MCQTHGVLPNEVVTMSVRLPIAAAVLAGLALVACGDGDTLTQVTTPTPSEDTSSDDVATAEPTNASETATDAPAEVTVEEAVAAGLDDGSLCPDSIAGPDDPVRGNTTTADLDDGTTLVALSCAAFAYQEEVQVLLFDGTQLIPLEVPTWNESGELVLLPTIAGWVSVQADPPGISSVTLYRGLGDCGTSTDAELVDGALEAVTIREQPCEEEPSADNADPGNWPVVLGS